MGSVTPFRTLLSALLAALLLVAAATGECAACAFTQDVAVTSGHCCMPDGSCHSSSSMAGCPNARTVNPALVEPAVQLHSALADSVVALPESNMLVFTFPRTPVPDTIPHATPDLHLLNSTLLI